MELTKSKLNKIIKKYNTKLEQHNQQWVDLCRKKYKTKDLGDGKIQITTPSIFEHEQHNSKGSQLFKDIMEELSKYDVFENKWKHRCILAEKFIRESPIAVDITKEQNDAWFKWVKYKREMMGH